MCVCCKIDRIGVSTVKKPILAFAVIVALFTSTALVIGGDFSNNVSPVQNGALAEQSRSDCVVLTASLLGEHVSDDVSWGHDGAPQRLRSGRNRNTRSEHITTDVPLIAFPRSRHFEDSIAAPAISRVRACVLRC